MDIHEIAWDAHCDYHNAKNEQLLQAKLAAMQAAGDALAEMLADIACDMPSETYRMIETKLTAWNKAKEQQ